MTNINYSYKKAVLYARVSTEEQASRDNSIPAQVAAIKHFAAINNIEIVKEYIDEGKSARTADRPQFQQMISDAKKKNKDFSIILVHKTDRFSRNRNDSAVYKSLLRKDCKVEVISVTELFDDSPQGQLLEGMMEVIAEFHSLNLSQEVMKGMKQKASKAVYLGKSPYGYKINESTKKLSIIEDEAAVVTTIFQMYSQGDSFSKIKSYLNNLGILTRENKLWDSSAIKRIVKNPVYTGQYIWNKTCRSKNITKPLDQWIVIQNSHPPIISNELFEEVQRTLAAKSIIRGKAVKSIYLLSGMLKCGHCGHNMIGEKKKHISGKVYIRYVCGNYLNHKQCFYNFVHKEEIEKLVLDEIKDIVKTGQADIENIVVVESTTSISEKEIFETNLKKIKLKFEKQLEAFESGILTLEELQQAKERVSREESDIKDQLKLLNDKLYNKDVSIKLKEHFTGVEELVSLNDPTRLKLWLKERIYSIEVFNKADIVIKYRLPW